MTTENSEVAVGAKKQTPYEAQKAELPELIDLGAIFLGLLRCKYFILIFAGIGFIQGVQSLKSFVPKYEAVMVVSPTEGTVSGSSKSGTGLKKVAESFGINVSGVSSKATNFDRLRYTIGSIPLVEILDKKYNLLHRIYEGSWDSETNSWKKPVGRRFEFEQSIRRTLNLKTWREPSLESLAEWLKSAIIVDRLIEVPFFKVSFQHPEPEMARWMLQTVYAEADRFLRLQDKVRALAKKDYIDERLGQTNIVEQRTVLVSLLASEERRLMLLEGNLPYAAEVVNPVFVSSTPTAPSLVKNFGVRFIGWLIGGLILSLLYVLLRTERR